MVSRSFGIFLTNRFSILPVSKRWNTMLRTPRIEIIPGPKTPETFFLIRFRVWKSTLAVGCVKKIELDPNALKYEHHFNSDRVSYFNVLPRHVVRESYSYIKQRII